MIIARAPFRVSFFGGGTDYPSYFRQHGGSVLATSIDKYCWITLRQLPPFFDYSGRIVYSKTELFHGVDEIQHPVVREGLKLLGATDRIELHHDGDLPARTGLGSSSSFTVCFLHALHALAGRMPDKMQLAREAMHVEQVLCSEHVGCQDQVLAAFGGFHRIDFSTSGEISLTPILLPPERAVHLQRHLMLWFTGFSSFATGMGAEQERALAERTRELARLQALVQEAQDLLTGTGDVEGFGELLHESWMVKRQLAEHVSTPEVDQAYEAARKAGAIGGKLLGAGGGGFLLLFVKPEDQYRVHTALAPRLHVPFRFERQGSQIIFYEP
jgi:D-glycero-alpha-D-manno-heptose-7-phosphate kinase